MLSKDKYIKEAFRQLDTKYYERLYLNPLLDMKKQFDSLLKEALDEGCINDNDFSFFTVEHLVIAAFYLLPMVHKEPKDNPPDIPIIWGNDTLTEPASKYIDNPTTSKKTSHEDMSNRFSDRAYKARVIKQAFDSAQSRLQKRYQM